MSGVFRTGGAHCTTFLVAQPHCDESKQLTLFANIMRILLEQAPSGGKHGAVVIAVDAYNGTPLWRREVANSLRLGAFLDGSNMVVDDRYLYIVADDTCQTMDVASGDPGPTMAMPQLIAAQKRHWGYVPLSAAP